MIALHEGHAPVPEPHRARRSPRKPGDQAPKTPPVRVAKSKDAGKVKVSFYLDAQTSEKLAVAAILRRVDQSDVANEVLARALSSIAYYDRAQTRAAGEPLTVTEIGAAAGSE